MGDFVGDVVMVVDYVEHGDLFGGVYLFVQE